MIEITSFKIGDRVRITGENVPPDKYGKEGIIELIIVNGAFIQLDNGTFTPVNFDKLEKI